MDNLKHEFLEEVLKPLLRFFFSWVYFFLTFRKNWKQSLGGLIACAIATVVVLLVFPDWAKLLLAFASLVWLPLRLVQSLNLWNTFNDETRNNNTGFWSCAYTGVIFAAGIGFYRYVFILYVSGAFDMCRYIKCIY